MAKKRLKNIFNPSVDQVDQTYTINAWHVSQSVDAFTGVDDYEISLSGSMAITGALSSDDDVFFSGLNGTAQTSVVTINTSTGQLFYASASSLSGSTDYIYSASYDSSSALFSFFGSGSAYTGSVDLSPLTGSIDYIYSASFDTSSNQISFFNSGSAFSGTIDLSSLSATGSTDYIYSASFNSSSTQLDFFGSGSGFTGSVDLSYLTASDYVSNVTLDTDVDGTADLLFTGVGNAFNGTASLKGLRDNSGGFTARYSGSVIIGRSGSGTGSAWPFSINGAAPLPGEPNRVISTTAPHLTASGVYEWHFSDINREFSTQYQNNQLSLFNLMTGSITDDNQVLVRVYDDINPRYEAFYTNVGPATIGNINIGGDLILSMSWVGGTGFGALSGIAFGFPNGTTPNNTNVSFEILGSGGSGSIDYVYSSSFNSTSSVLNFFGSGSAFTGNVDLSSLGGSGSVDYVYSASFDTSSGNFDFFGSGSGYDGTVILNQVPTSSIALQNFNAVTYNTSSFVLSLINANGGTSPVTISKVLSSSNAVTASYGPNIYNENGTLSSPRTVQQDNNSLTFNSQFADWTIRSSGSQRVIISGLPDRDNFKLLNVDGDGVLGLVSTSSFKGDGNYIYSASFDAGSSVLDFFGSGSAFTGSVDLSSLGGSGSIDYVYSSSFDIGSNSLIFYGSGSAFTGSVDLRRLNTNIANSDLDLDDDHITNLDGNALTFGVYQGETFKISSSNTSEVLITDLPNTSTPNVIAYDSSSGQLSYISTASFGGSSTPGGTDTQVQYNNGGSFGGSSIRFNDVNNSVGINVTPYSNRVFAVSSSAGIAMRLQSAQATANRIQFFNASSVGAGVIAGTINGDDFHLQQTDITLQENLYVSASGETFLPRISNSNQQHLVAFDTASGELTYITSSQYTGAGVTLYTGDGTISGNRNVTYTSSGYFNITGSGGASVSSFSVWSNEILFPQITSAASSPGYDVLLWNSANGRLFYTASSAYRVSGSDGEVQFNDNGNFGAESTFTYDKSNNTLEVVGAHAQPGLRLSNNLSVPFAGVTLAEIEAFQGSDQAGAIRFIADSTVGSGDVPTRLEFQVTPDNSGTAQTRMTIKNTGRVGIGTTNPSNGFLEVSGDVSGTSIYASANIVAYSDARSKTNVTTIENALDKVDAIRGVTYNKVEDPDGIRYMGVIAQELQDVLPEVVAEGEDGNLAVAYGNIVGVLIEAVKELRAEIKELKEGK